MATNASDPAAREYAVALYMLATEKESLQPVYDDLSAMDTAYRSDRDFRGFFTSPKVPSALKLEVIEKALGDKLNPIVKNFIGLLVRKGRESLLDNIADAFEKYRDEAENRVHVLVESANELDNATRDKLIEQIAKSTGKSVDLRASVNEGLIGGMKIRIDDQLLDNSLASRLAGLSRLLQDSDAYDSLKTDKADLDAMFDRIRGEVAAAS